MARVVGSFLIICGELIFLLPFGILLIGTIAAQTVAIVSIVGVFCLIFYIKRMCKIKPSNGD